MITNTFPRRGKYKPWPSHSEPTPKEIPVNVLGISRCSDPDGETFATCILEFYDGSLDEIVISRVTLEKPRHRYFDMDTPEFSLKG